MSKGIINHFKTCRVLECHWLVLKYSLIWWSQPWVTSHSPFKLTCDKLRLASSCLCNLQWDSTTGITLIIVLVKYQSACYMFQHINRKCTPHTLFHKFFCQTYGLKSKCNNATFLVLPNNSHFPAFFLPKNTWRILNLFACFKITSKNNTFLHPIKSLLCIVLSLFVLYT